MRLRLSSTLKNIVICSCLVLTTACASTGSKHSSNVNDMASSAAGVGDVERFYGEHVSPDREAELRAQDIYYFGYDLYDVSPEDRLSIYAHAKKMLENPRMVVRISGHTDERGSREYNVALGERRAKAVANILMMKGVSPHQIHTVSYGKEKPVAMGHDESAWKQNRRAVIVYEVE